MTNSSSLDLDLAALLSARLCHDLAGPVGAVNNGAELLAEGGAESMEDARELISNCAGQAVRRLRFFRLAYGSHHGSMDWAGALDTGAAMLADSKVEFAWHGSYDNAEERALAGAGKLALNMVLLAANALPRGGQLEFAAAGEVGAPRIAIRGKGAMVILDDISADVLASGCRRDGAVLKELNARYVQPYLTGLLAAELGLVVRVEASGEGLFEVSSAPA